MAEQNIVTGEEISPNNRPGGTNVCRRADVPGLRGCRPQTVRPFPVQGDKMAFRGAERQRHVDLYENAGKKRRQLKYAIRSPGFA